jgi:glycosyltransferase involved in cell wall biosynthesis
MQTDLTIVIPARNEANMLPSLLQSLCEQDYEEMGAIKVIVADAGSTDDTVMTTLSFRDRLLVEVISGGLPSVGRNAGAQLATTRFLLFPDADVELPDPTLLRRAMCRMRRKNLHFVTTNIACSEGGFVDGLLYAGNNFIQRVGSFTKPFATGMFMLFERNAFWALGGFNERALFAEDYLLSKGVPRLRFGIVRGRVLTTNRRFQKLGHWTMVRMFVRTMMHSWDDGYFLRTIIIGLKVEDT